jgi:hypothetical protein
LIRDVFSGAQNYGTLKGRLWKQVSATLVEIARSLVEPQNIQPSLEREIPR